jgi:hypothetical protein
VGEGNIAGKQLQRLRRQVVGAEEFAVIEEGLDVRQQPFGGDRGLCVSVIRPSPGSGPRFISIRG